MCFLPPPSPRDRCCYGFNAAEWECPAVSFLGVFSEFTTLCSSPRTGLTRCLKVDRGGSPLGAMRNGVGRGVLARVLIRRARHFSSFVKHGPSEITPSFYSCLCPSPLKSARHKTDTSCR
ncbi:hypothetical protein chiPu_0021705 [Chiloscyllium punctatum]|uniref:Uncharacterized protein n=1 Tax=Chiloscyllium punctatum TaxID=137246 RepID=A0A401RKM7_CHIPU|nr:hypothetical protein [Chiloscyllium punctatum]